MKHVHFMGIGGSGASAAAAIAQAYGFLVSGCDKQLDGEFTSSFKKNQLYSGHNPNHLEGVQILAMSPAILSLDPQNHEVARAREVGIETLTWQEFMGKYLERNKFVIAVCGTHGKSTTTAMIAKILEEAGEDPTVELGAVIPDWSQNYRIGRSRYFLTEADEFNDNYLVTHPDIAVVTTIELDHPEYFKDLESVKASFIKFLEQTKQLIVANLSDPNVAEVIKVVMKHSKVRVLDYSKSDFQIKLQIPGKYNVLNASGAFHVGLALDINPDKIKKSLQSYKGISRRQELIGEVNGALVFSDFGHHPTEIRVTIEALGQKYNDREIIVIFQPHMFSRTKALFSEFVKLFQELPIERGYILAIYPSREVDTGVIHSEELVEAIGRDNIEYVKESSEIKERLSKINSKHLIVFQGAGSIDKLARDFVKENS